MKEDAELNPPKVKTPRKKGKKKAAGTNNGTQETEPSPIKVGEATDDDLRDTT